MSAIISQCGKFRYRLERDVQMDGLTFAYFGINPSTADATLDDATVRKWIGFTKVNGGRRFIVGNVSAYRATDVKELADVLVTPDQWCANLVQISRIIEDADVTHEYEFPDDKPWPDDVTEFRRATASEEEQK
ncbi:Uncharacterized protein conserved in bacteria [Burkholderia pseudomallei]|uniref:DUF1643 domain-containing protein n=1 Tax=Burkholderia pseudomallei TaxID=28450 RepID=UPI000F1CB2BA|nr:DUF1643 domain-containing protein [Burkholderia pseudomallei]CAJ2900305.1 Uncharacterized protein conserved in bacteria [Burkholderia pseudomallei]VCG48335.1 Uncharacterized protein conserved in bacteria [Burkholderia pseudomallei]VCG67542.1 Uncharacterized protein conserved in bacteria [Burkholderia pseudomallei]VCG69800.1 Uncharacterized protein conserved in bacteria [Burkholderia pseudomallei]VCG73359.1 Uncharacterized protein conserved in bacteria [Burkholderia pseudomallei]